MIPLCITIIATGFILGRLIARKLGL